jgi:CBS domain-containing protein
MLRVHDVLALKGHAIYTIAPSETLKKAIDALVTHDVGSLLVVEKGYLTGLLTFREVLKALHESDSIATRTVRDCMLTDFYIANPNDSISHVAEELLQRKVRYVPVVEADSIYGIISFHDIQKSELEERHFENQLLKRYIKNWPEDNDDSEDPDTP